jgi:HTH-type transcriptional regulator / antitoxin HigA
MAPSTLISNDRQANNARATIAALDKALSSEQVLKAIVQGLPRQAVDGIRKSLATEQRELSSLLEGFERAKTGDLSLLRQQAGKDPGAALIVARISRGLSQKELARKLGLREQAIQRYEAENYRSVSLSNFQKFATVLGVDWRLDLVPTLEDRWNLSYDLPQSQARKVLQHARKHGWLKEEERSDEDTIGVLMRYVADHVVKYGTPSLLRTGLNVAREAEDWVLLSWKARVTRRAEPIIESDVKDYQPLELSWLLDLVRLSELDNGPSQAANLLKEHGIVLIAEPQIAGMTVDGAAFLVGQTPVIGMTLLRNTVDNFWFTLLHEVAHVVLHYRTGLATGFFDDVQNPTIDQIEDEANQFAANLLIPEEVWVRSPARIAKSAAPIEKLARQLRIHPAVIFGRIRMERKDYSLFANKIGQGTVRNQFFLVTQ